MAERPRILVVDDEVEIRRTLAEILEDEGYRVDLAENGQEALGLIDPDCPPVLILLDLMMPVMDGWTFLAALRSEQGLARIPVVIVSAASHHAPAPSPPVKQVMSKPLSIDRLLEAVSRCAA